MTTRLIGPLLALALVLGACSSDEAAPQASESPEPTPVEVSPVTGEPMPDGLPENPVLVVKIENTASGAPQYGLDEADLVVEELVEGGLTRLAAMFYSSLPSTVGHVRSVRTTDVGIAQPVAGHLVASGGAGRTLRLLDKAGVDVVSEDAGAAGFSSDPAKSRPFNRMVDLTRVAKDAEVGDIPGPYLDWTATEGEDEDTASEEPAPTPTPAESVSVRFSPASTTEWELEGETWQRTNGHAGDADFRADTMIAMFCEVGDAGYTDAGGYPVPETIVEGSGRAVVLTAEGAVETTWTKEGTDDTISFEAEDGSPVTIDPGHVWISLVPEGDGAVDLG